jgi:hypothetical protein
MTRRLLLSALTAVLVVGATAASGAASNPWNAWDNMFRQSMRQSMRWHPPRYHVRKPIPVKAAPDETPAAAPPPPAPTRVVAQPPDSVLPIPEPRPAETPAVAPAAPASRSLDLSEIPDAVLPIPEARPAAPPKVEIMPPLSGQKPAAAVAAGTPARDKSGVKVASLTPPSEPTEEKPGAPGSGALAALGVRSIPLDPIEKGPCTVLDPVSISAFESGDVTLAGKAVLNDHMAETVAHWVHDDVVPAAHEILAGDLTGLRILDSYNCRTRYDIPGNKMSEHGFANAIDIGAFRIGKRWIVVGGDKHNAADDARFLDTVRHAACHRFTTVLGPGQPAHDNHFHLDLGRHGKTGKYTICE